MFSELTHTADKVVGLKQVLKGAQAGELSCIYIAQDADADIRRRLLDAAHRSGTQHIMVPTRSQLGQVCGIKVPAACAGLVKKDN